MRQLGIQLLLAVATINAQSRLKGKSKEIKAIDNFSFLVEGGNLVTASTVRLEQLDILIGLDFEELQWREILVQFDDILEAFPKLPFFVADRNLAEEYVGLCMLGQRKFNQFHQHMSACFRFKNEKNRDTPVNLCSKTPIEIEGAEMLRGKENLKFRLDAIDANWSVETIRTDAKAQNALFEFCSYFNDFSMTYEKIADEMLTAMEMLSDNAYPEVLFGELKRDCEFSINGDGEQYDVVECTKTNKGYRC